MNTINFTIISEIEDVISFIKDYAENVYNGDYGYKDGRLTDMPKVYDCLQKWESKNVSMLTEEDKEHFYEAKKCIEKLMVHFKIDSVEVLIKK
ncbi:MAG: hypothetical protein ACYCZ2_19640 [Lutibacter sp.]